MLPRFIAGRAGFSGNGGAGFFDNERDQRQRSDTIKPPPAQNSRGRESDDQNDREITADNRFDGVCAQRTRVQSRGNFQFVSRKNGHHDLGNDTNQNAPDTFMGVSNSFDDKNSVTGIEEHIHNERIKRISNPSRRVLLDGLDMFGRGSATYLYSEPPQ